MNHRLITALEALPVDWPAVPELALDAGQTAARPSSFVLRWAGVAAAALVVVIGFVAPVREAVADWLGIGVVRVEVVDVLPEDLGTALDLGEPVDVGIVGVPAPEQLPDPAAAFVRDGEASLVWPPSDALPAVGDTGVGAILTRFDGSFEPTVEKSLSLASTLQVVTIDGERAYWIEGEPHAFAYLDAEGIPIETSARLAGNTLIWESDGLTWRFESALDLQVVLGLFDD